MVVKIPVARLNNAPASIAPQTRLRLGSVSRSNAARAVSSLSLGVLIPSSVWWNRRRVSRSMSFFFSSRVSSGGG